MANSNFVVQNGLQVGSLTIFAGNSDITTSGNISVTGSGSFGGLSSNQIYQGTGSNVNVATTAVTVGIAGSGNVATFNSSGLTVTNLTVTGVETINQVEVVQGNLVAASGTATTSTTTGALVVAGGQGISGNIFLGGSIIPSANVSSNLGDSTHWFNTFYGISTQAKYADLAENYQADKPYNPGTVLQFGGSAEVTVAEANTPRVAGIVSTNPAHLMNGALAGTGVVALALTGRVPCNVIGPIAKGDMMVSAGFGFARADANPAPGTVIGKALTEFPINGKGVIEVVVGRL
ncbi:hypothetical protein UFOVP190_87 [uncultured Caudovirales phage]|uniref:Uncharacterized protein n=1 Tax=uncultured Caudovirales phage TaxID=2100421 RepID=A0A6J7WHA6_9CAUD|nr:hypothetical protein UFOVP190_87 [uncultured Caudovirales phage]